MQATDLAAIVVCIVSLVAIAGLTIAAIAIVRTMRELRGLLETLQNETLPLVSELRMTVDQAEVDLVRVEGAGCRRHQSRRDHQSIQSKHRLRHLRRKYLMSLLLS